MEAHGGFLIERGQRHGHNPPIWFAENGEWTSDASEALRYPTRDAADTAIRYFELQARDLPWADVIEHGWYPVKSDLTNGTDSLAAHDPPVATAENTVTDPERAPAQHTLTKDCGCNPRVEGVEPS